MQLLRQKYEKKLKQAINNNTVKTENRVNECAESTGFETKVTGHKYYIKFELKIN